MVHLSILKGRLLFNEPTRKVLSETLAKSKATFSDNVQILEVPFSSRKQMTDSSAYNLRGTCATKRAESGHGLVTHRPFKMCPG
jgi:hypothetical protein